MVRHWKVLFLVLIAIFSLSAVASADEDVANDTNIFQNHKHDYNQVISHLKNIISEKIAEIPKSFSKKNQTVYNENSEESVISEVFASNDIKNKNYDNSTENCTDVGSDEGSSSATVTEQNETCNNTEFSGLNTTRPLNMLISPYTEASSTTKTGHTDNTSKKTVFSLFHINKDKTQEADKESSQVNTTAMGASEDRNQSDIVISTSKDLSQTETRNDSVTSDSRIKNHTEITAMDESKINNQTDVTPISKDHIDVAPATENQTELTPTNKNLTEVTSASKNRTEIAPVDGKYKNDISPNQTLTERVKSKISKIIPMLMPSFKKKDNFTTDNAYRLPRNVIPEHYHLNIITYLDESKNFAFNGQVAIAVRCVHSTQQIVLHALDLEIDEKDVEVLEMFSGKSKKSEGTKNDTWINGQNLVTRSGYVSKVNESLQNDFYRLELSQELKRDRSYVVMIKFRGILKETLSGYYRCSYKNEEGKQVWLSVTQFEPTDARKAFPCFDEPDLKATFDINLLHQKQYRAISNAPALTATTMLDNPDWQWTNFSTTPKMSTYLVFFMVSDFEFRAVKQNDFVYEVYARPNAINQTTFALRESPNILQELTQYLYTPYALQKWPIKLIAVPEFSAGAMENWGAITFREALLLYDDQSSDTKSRYSITSVIAHELTHQWLGNLVTLKWWNDLWLNEGVTTYVTGLIVEKTHPEWNSLLENTAKMVTNLLEVDSLKGSHQVSVTIGNPNDIGQIFDSISYSKGSMILRMLDLILSDNIFRLGLKSYLAEHAYSNAQKDDLWRHLSASYKKERLDKNSSSTGDNFRILNSETGVKTIMDSWTLQTGYPLINVRRDYDKNTAYITQERYLMERIQTPTDHSKREENLSSKNSSKQCWYVPLSYTAESEMDFENTRPKKWLVCPEHMKFYRSTNARNHRNDNATTLGLDIKNNAESSEGNKSERVEVQDSPGSLVLQDMPGKDDWVIFNIQLAGLYRVNYDLQNWEKIIAMLQTPDYNKIHILNRVQLIDDSLDLAWTGDQSYAVALKLVSYLKHETEYISWNCGLKNLGRLKRALMHREGFHLFEKYISQFISPMYERLGGLNNQLKVGSSEPKRSDNITDKSRPEDRIKHQILISSWACRYGISDCRQKAVQYFDEFMVSYKTKTDKGIDVIPADLVPIVYCTAVRYSDQIRNLNKSTKRTAHRHPVVRTYNLADLDTADDINCNNDTATQNVTEESPIITTNQESSEKSYDDKDVFDFLWKLGENENLAPSQLTSVLKALACTTDETKALRYLNTSLEPNSFIRRQDAHIAFSGIASNSKTYLIARRFLYERIKDIHEHLGSKSNKLASYVDSVASQITNEKEYEELLEFTIQNAKYLSHSQLGIKKSLESAKIMIQWQKYHYEEVIKLLQEYTQ